MRRQPQRRPPRRLFHHEIIIGFLRIERRYPFAVGGATADEADRFVEHVGVIARTLEEHLVIVGLAELFGILRKRIIIPRILDRKSTRLNYSHSCASRMPSSA